MKENLIKDIELQMQRVLNNKQLKQLNHVLVHAFQNENNIPIEFTKALARGDKFVYRSKQYK